MSAWQTTQNMTLSLEKVISFNEAQMNEMETCGSSRGVWTPAAAEDERPGKYLW